MTACCKVWADSWESIIVAVEDVWQLAAKRRLPKLEKYYCGCWSWMTACCKVRADTARKALLWMIRFDDSLLQSKGCHSWKSNIIDGNQLVIAATARGCMTACYGVVVVTTEKNIILAVDLRWQLFREQQLLSKGILIPWLSSSCLLLVWLDYAGRLPSGVGGFAHDGHVVSGRWTAGGLRLDDLDKLLKVSAGIFCGNISERHLDLWLFRFARGAENFKSYKFMQVLFITGSFLIFVSKTIE